jgi:hypothetical protein
MEAGQLIPAVTAPIAKRRRSIAILRGLQPRPGRLITHRPDRGAITTRVRTRTRAALVGRRVSTCCEIIISGMLVLIRGSLITLTRRLIMIRPRLILITAGLIAITGRLILARRRITRHRPEIGATRPTNWNSCRVAANGTAWDHRHQLLPHSEQTLGERSM